MKKTVHSAVSVFLPLGLLAGLLVCQLTGCSLAAEDGISENGGDRLVGMFLTTEYVDAVDWDHVDISALMEDGTVSGGEEKIYGTFDQEKGEYVFEGLEGYSLGVINLKDEDGEAYLASVASDCFSDVHLNMGDLENTCSGVLYFDRTQIGSEYVIYEDESWKEIYKGQDIVVNNVIQEDGSEAYEVCADGKDLQLYGNAVYETQEGAVYLVPGSGVRITDAEGDWSVTLSDTVTEVNNGKKTEAKNTFQATYRGVCPAQSVKFSWQDENGNVLKEECYAADKIPASIKWGRETAYILVALQKTDKTTDYDLIRGEEETYMLYTEKEPENALILESMAVEVER
ncbi:MAG: hypothetical protein ACI4D3_07860 [Lachnospiraceae bacterium]